MNLKTVAVTYGRKQNLGDYSSANVEVTFWADVDPDEDEAEVMGALWQMARENVRAQLGRLLPERISAKVEETFLGLPKKVQAAIEEEYHGHQGAD